MRSSGRHRVLRAGGVATTLMALMIVPMTAPGADASMHSQTQSWGTCAYTHRIPTRRSLARARWAVLCEINAERRVYGLAPLSENRRLDLGASHHSYYMVRERIFSHTGYDGTPMSRQARSGYLNPSGAYKVSENVGWGDGRYSTPAAMMSAWQDPGHRVNILDPGVRDIGIGIAVGVPWSGDRLHGATYTTDFAWRG
jgi:uncharacterized protein YkwD